MEPAYISNFTASQTIVCPKMEDVEGCETNVRDWWPGMNAIYFNSVDIVSGICLGVDACEQGL